jgi:hypothetical protein
MLLAANALRFLFDNGGHEVSLALKLKFVARRIGFLAHIMVSPAHIGT